jgi:ApbE superfamily uncharacterized protein (UPF0280 family)
MEVNKFYGFVLDEGEAATLLCLAKSAHGLGPMAEVIGTIGEELLEDYPELEDLADRLWEQTAFPDICLDAPLVT